MGLSNCRQCGKLYLENNFGLCVDCLKEQEEDELKVVAYLRDVVDRASVEEIHKATGVKEKVIMRMVKQGRIIGSAIITYPCESCGAAIEEGRLCQSCSSNILSQLSEQGKKEAEPERKGKAVRMYSKED